MKCERDYLFFNRYAAIGVLMATVAVQINADDSIEMNQFNDEGEMRRWKKVSPSVVDLEKMIELYIKHSQNAAVELHYSKYTRFNYYWQD